MRGLFLLFIIVPVVELMVLLKVGSLIGALPTIALLLFMAAAGIYIVKRQGFSTLMRAQQRMQSGEVPAKELMEGFMLALGGVLLLIPGFISDVIALFFILPFILPFIRRPLVSYLLRAGHLQGFGNNTGSAQFGRFGAGWQQGPGFKPHGGKAYEGEFTREPAPGTSLIEHDDAPPPEEK